VYFKHIIHTNLMNHRKTRGKVHEQIKIIKNVSCAKLEFSEVQTPYIEWHGIHIHKIVFIVNITFYLTLETLKNRNAYLVCLIRQLG